MIRSLLALTIAALVLRIWSIHDSLWLDELHTSWVIMGAPSQIIPRAQIGNQSPIWFVFPWLTTSIVKNEFGLRLPSLVSGCLLIVATFWTTKQWIQQDWPALFAAGVVAVNFDAMFYSQEARVYSTVQLFAMIHAGLLAHRWSRQFGFSASTDGQSQLPGPVCWVTKYARIFCNLNRAWLLYLHYTTILFLFAEIIFVLSHGLLSGKRLSSQRFGSSIRQLIEDGCVTVLICLPISWHFWEVFTRRANWTAFVVRQPASELFLMFALGCYLPLSVIAALSTMSALWPASTNSIVVPAERDPGRKTGWMLGGLWLVVPMLSAWLLTEWSVAPLFHRRYLVAASLAPAFLSGLLLSAVDFHRSRWTLIARWIALIATLALVVGRGGYATRMYRDGRFLETRYQDWRTAIQRLNTLTVERATPVFLVSALIESDASAVDAAGREYLQFPLRAMYELTSTTPVIRPLARKNWERLSQSDLTTIEQAGRAVFLVNSQKSNPEVIGNRVIDLNARLHARFRLGLAESFEDIRLVEVVAN